MFDRCGGGDRTWTCQHLLPDDLIDKALHLDVLGVHIVVVFFMAHLLKRWSLKGMQFVSFMAAEWCELLYDRDWAHNALADSRQESHSLKSFFQIKKSTLRGFRQLDEN
jgi:hypothetical protein